MDLSQLSTDDLLALKGGDISKVSTEGLTKLKDSISQQTEPKGGNIERFAKGALEGIGQAGVGMMQAAGELIAPTPMFGMKPASGTVSSVAQPTKDLLTQTIDSSQNRVNDMGTLGYIGSIAGNIAGSLPATLAAGPTLGAEAMAARAAPGAVRGAVESVAKGAAQGAVAGAQAGVGKNDSRLDNAAAGALLGGAVGTVKPVVDASKGALDVGKRLLTGRDADAVLQDIIGRSDKTPQQLLEALKDKQISGIADIAGDDVQGLTRSVAKQPMAKNIISDALEGRSMGAVQRISSHLSKDVSDVDTYFGNLEDVSKARAMASAPLYKQAYQEGQEIITPELNKYLQDSRVVAAQNVARKDYGVRLDARPNSIESLDGVKKVLDDQISAAMQGGQKNLAGSLLELKNGMVGVMDKAAPSYAKARKVFGGFAQMENAQKEGLEFTRQTPEQLKMRLEDMTPDQKEAFRIGVRQNLQTTVNKTGDGNDPARRIFGNTQQRQQLETIFGGSKQFNQFADKMIEETNAARTKQRVLGGSRTDFNIDADSAFEDVVDAVARQGLKQGLASQVAEKSIGWLKNRYLGINDDNAKIIANALVDRKAGIAALERLVAKTGTPESKAASEAIDAIQSQTSKLRDAPDPRSKPYRIDIIRRSPK